jgi:hypothetical protein
MAEPILHKSPPEEPKKSELNLPEICLKENQHLPPKVIEPINALEGPFPLIKAASVCYLPGPADHFIGILEETISNLTRLQKDLNEIEGMLAKGGEL